MYGPCSPCGKCSRLQQRLHAATKATTKRLRTAVKAAKKVTGCCEGCNTAKKAAVKAATKVVGYFESCHIGCRLLRRLQQRLLVAAEAIAKVAGCCYAKAMASTFLLKQALTQAPTKVTQPSFPKQSITKAAPFKHDRGCENGFKLVEGASRRRGPPRRRGLSGRGASEKERPPMMRGL
ncbi:hypothetical protein Tco_1233854 [Tanacetum coccineum]